MKNWKEELVALLEAGKKPTYEQLEVAVECAITERNAMEQTVVDMAQWLSRLVAAYLHGEGNHLTDVMKEFITARVKVQVQGLAETPPQAPTN